MERLDINHASVQEIAKIMGNEGLANSLVEYRQSVSPFHSPEDFKKVPGIDDEIFEALRDKFDVKPISEEGEKSAQMLETVVRFADAFGRRSTAECLACFKQSDSLMTYGTAADEKRIGVDALRARLERNWSQSIYATMKMVWHTSTLYDDSGWVAADFAGRFKTSESEGERLVRTTFVLECDEHSKWVIAHMHFSFPDALTEEGHSFPSAKSKETIRGTRRRRSKLIRR